ncbi:Rik1-associated factor 1 [Ceratocystis fimbriata CBS 114723]|uniref:Rik1-associated factor 1 n=1 Tax=Ceratocystis fimbriata CBS 114723 TaxID=1035309 RepID=A0A2C5X1M6_9PEZI|nr:Rik1-associated factor 1 [Ceratocystis fimbriata CBS 114723]
MSHSPLIIDLTTDEPPTEVESLTTLTTSETKSKWSSESDIGTGPGSCSFSSEPRGEKSSMSNTLRLQLVSNRPDELRYCQDQQDYQSHYGQVLQRQKQNQSLSSLPPSQRRLLQRPSALLQNCSHNSQPGALLDQSIRENSQPGLLSDDSDYDAAPRPRKRLRQDFDLRWSPFFNPSPSHQNSTLSGPIIRQQTINNATTASNLYSKYSYPVHKASSSLLASQPTPQTGTDPIDDGQSLDDLATPIKREPNVPSMLGLQPRKNGHSSCILPSSLLDPDPLPQLRPESRNDGHMINTGIGTKTKISTTLASLSPSSFQPLNSSVRDPRRKPPEIVKDPDRVVPIQSTWHQAGSWPYLPSSSRQGFLDTLTTEIPAADLQNLPPGIKFHVDFTPNEINYILQAARMLVSFKKPPSSKIRELSRIIHKRPSSILDLSKLEGQDALRRRGYMDIYNFLSDVNYRQANYGDPQALSIEHDQTKGARERYAKLSSMRFSREVEGRLGFGRSRRYLHVKNDMLTLIEDNLDVRYEWTNCAGDIATVSWLSPDTFICGTITHSDSHNQQYNKPGNLLIGSVKDMALRALPDHRISRPIVEKGENSTDAMRESQDPWLYSSVVSSAFDEDTGLTYTASFDHTVKIWRPDANLKGSIKCVATWQHAGNVNFVLPRGSLVATGMDVTNQAVRVYTMDPNGDISKSRYRSFGNQVGPANMSISTEEDKPKWGYLPATMQWGKGAQCRHHLLVGYSPRSFTKDESDIPQNRCNSGVVRVWDTVTGNEIMLNFPLAQNVFEVAWHPSKSTFAVATSATTSIMHSESRIKTQIRIWSYAADNPNITTGTYHLKQTLDCYSADINEITIRPNSNMYSYVTAATTDGRVYVWDTAGGDRPMHILHHGRSVDPLPDGSELDTGVRFTLWGSTSNRLYTGGSDGVLRVWNIRNKKPFVRNLIEVPGPLMAGAFSADFSRMVIGDASGRVFLLTNDVMDSRPSNFLTLTMPDGKTRRIRRPQPFTPHVEPLLPEGHLATRSSTEGVARARAMLLSGQITLHPNPTIGAVQGPLYPTLDLYRTDAHLEGNITLGLTDEFASKQQEILRGLPQITATGNSNTFSHLGELVRHPRNVVANTDEIRMHLHNLRRDFSLDRLQSRALAQLRAEGAQLELEHDFEYESDTE